jgi:PBSX family phage portal protein
MSGEEVFDGDHPFGDTVEDVRAVACHLVGEGEPVTKMLGKRRPDEEDYWPEETVRLEKGQSEQQSEAPEDEQTIEILEPPLPMASIVTAFEESNSLRQNVDAMVTNVDGFGFTLAPAIDFKGNEFKELIEDQILLEEGEAAEQELEARQKEVRREAVREKRSLKSFFAFCADESFIELRRSSREDLEVLGNFAWEVLRDEDDEIRRFVHIPFYTMRLTKKGDPVTVTVKRKIDAVTYEEFEEEKRFRRFVQIVGQKKIWFKEFGDPRPMSKNSGQYYENEEEIKKLAETNPDEGVASEVLHYKIRAIRGAYGLPRWIGNLLSVRGSRLSEEVNYFYFNNKAIPPMLIFVENGRLQGGAADRLSEFMKQVKGDTQKFWRVAILEGESSEDARKRGVTWSGQPRFKVVKLSSEQLKDALFQEYDERNRDKVGESFRIPRLLRGDTRDFNRATAETAKAFSEEQVFQPERDRFDAWINRILGPELDMKYWVFKTLAPIVRNPITLTEMVKDLVKVGILTPKEGRVIAEDIFNREFEDIDRLWVEQPLALTLAGIVKRQQESDNAVTPPADVMHTLTKSFAELGPLGEAIDVESTIGRLAEIHRVLSGHSLLPDPEREDSEGTSDN